MSAVLDRPPGLVPTIGGSTYVRPSEMDWKPTRFEKVSIKVLYEDPDRGEMTCLLKLEPGAYIPFHKHPEIEQTLVLEGSVEDHDGWRWPEIISGASRVRCMTTDRPAAQCCSRCIANRTSITARRKRLLVFKAVRLRGVVAADRGHSGEGT